MWTSVHERRSFETLVLSNNNLQIAYYATIFTVRRYKPTVIKIDWKKKKKFSNNITIFVIENILCPLEKVLSNIVWWLMTMRITRGQSYEFHDWISIDLSKTKKYFFSKIRSDQDLVL